MDFENQTINEALNCAKKDFIPIRSTLARASDDEPWNAAFSEFERHCNQGLIGCQALVEHVSRNLGCCAGAFHLRVQRSLTLSKEILNCFD